jgi:predicted DNA-binding protein
MMEPANLSVVYADVYALDCGQVLGGKPMAATSEKMVRKQFLVPPSTVKRLEQLAAKRGTSASEIVRQAIKSFDLEDAEAMESSELMELVSTRLKEAIKSTRHAQRSVSKALQVVGSK